MVSLGSEWIVMKEMSPIPFKFEIDVIQISKKISGTGIVFKLYLNGKLCENPFAKEKGTKINYTDNTWFFPFIGGIFKQLRDKKSIIMYHGFMDNPLSLGVEKINNNHLKVSFNFDTNKGPKEITSTICEIKQFNDMLVQASKKVIDHLYANRSNYDTFDNELLNKFQLLMNDA